MDRIVLAYAGGPEASVAIPWLKKQYGAEIVAVTMDLGPGRELAQVRDAALAAGAVRAHVLDVREEFARDYVGPALKAGALHEDRDPMARALGLALVVRKLVEIATIEQAAAVAHGCGGESSGSGWFAAAARALAPDLVVIGPAREWAMTPQEDGVHENLWGRSIDLGLVEDPWTVPPETLYRLTRAAAGCPDEPAYVEISFDCGTPTAINGVPMPLVEIIASLNTIAGRHGIGRIDIVHDQTGGTQSRTLCEAPAASLLHMAHRELQAFVSTSDLRDVCRMVSLRYADVISHGLWFTPMREALDAFVEKVQERVSGVVRLELFKGDCRVLAVSLATDAQRLVTM